MSVPGPKPRVAVVGAGWAGLAAAVEATRRGAEVTVFEMAGQPGGRARTVHRDDPAGTGLSSAAGDLATAGPAATGHGAVMGDLDNGQHILIGAYTETLALMRAVGVDPEAVLLRRPLAFARPDGRGLVLPPGPAVPAFVRAVLAHRGWRLGERLALLRAAAGWRLRGFRCAPATTVAELTADLPTRVRDELIDPLCVAALNTPSTQASATVFLRVLRDALFAGPGAADLLLPRRRLGELLPEPACRWLARSGGAVHLGRRVRALARVDEGRGPSWRLDFGGDPPGATRGIGIGIGIGNGNGTGTGDGGTGSGGSGSIGSDGVAWDQVVLATPATEAARLTASLAPDWSARAAALRHEPIMTLYVRCPGTRLPLPMLALASDDRTRPGQFVFDLGALGGPPGLLALVVSGAAPWVDRGRDACWAAALRQLRDELGPLLPGTPEPVQLLVDKRATLLCTPRLDRPPMRIADGLWCAGDYVDGPYPSTLEGAVRAGLAAAGAATGTG